MPKQKKHIRKYKTPEGKTRYVYPKDRSNNYLSTLAKVAPVFGAKALLGDLPRGAIEQAVELKLRGSKDSLVGSVKRGLKGRGGGRAMGAGLGILTAPIFLKGVELASSKNKEDQKKGLAYIGLSTAAYQLPKGGLEGYRASRSVGGSVAKAIRKGGILGLTRSGYKLPASLAMGMSIAAGRKKGKGDKGSSFAQKLLIPALTGAALGAGSRSFENIVEQLSSGKPKNKAQVVKVLKKALPSAGGGAVGGLLGGVILSAAVEGATKALKKEASAAKGLLNIADKIDLVEGATRLVKKLPFMVGEAAGLHALTAPALGYAARPLGLPDLRKLPVKKVRNYVADKQSTQFAIGLREGLAGRTNAGIRSGLVTTIGMPELMVPRSLGLQAGGYLRKVPASRRAETLLKIKDYVKNNPSLKVHPRTGEPTPILHNIEDGIDKALGLKPLFKKSKNFPTFQKALQKAIYGGRGGLGKSLPKAGKLDPKSKLKTLGAPGAVFLTAMLGKMFTAPITPISALQTHMFISGLKGSLPYLPLTGPFLAREGKQEVRKGIIRGVFPGLKDTKGEKAFSAVKKYIVTPAIDDIARVTESIARHARDKALQSGMAAGMKASARKALLPKKKSVAKGLGEGALIGAATLGTLAAGKKAVENRLRRGNKK